MAKKQNGNQREELKAAIDPRKLVETVLDVDSEADNAPETPIDSTDGNFDTDSSLGRFAPEFAQSVGVPADSAQSVIKDVSYKGDPVVSDSGTTFTPEVISKPEAEMLARKFTNLKKEATLPLDETVAEVKTRNELLQTERAKRSQQSSRVIMELRNTDPVGVKTCGRCSQRVLITEMDSTKELCEVCAS